LQPLTAGVVGNPIWGPFMEFSSPTLLSVDIPSGLSERPSLWTGGTGVTVDPANNAVWTVAAGASSPAVSRSYKNRYELRMARLASGWTPGLSYNTDWPFMMKANLADAVTMDDPQWIAAVPYEDIWNWANYSYLGLQLVSPVAGTVTIKVTYKVPTLSDPCYTCAEHRWAEFTCTYTTRTATYTATVIAGSNANYIDLCKPQEGTVPQGEHRLHVITNVEITLPAGAGAWTLNALLLCHDMEHTSRVFHHNKRAWDWPGCAFGLGGFVDGKPCWQMDHGFRRYREEFLGLQYIQYRQHCPDIDPPPEQDPTYAEDLSRIYTKVNWQEGFTATWNDPVNAAGNKDTDGICFAPTMYWWDLQNQEESALSGAVCVGHYNWAYGAVHDIYYTCFPRGKPCGLAYSGGRRKRSTGTVWLYKSQQADGDYTRVGSYVPDSQGFWRSDPQLEKGWYYGVAGRDLGATVLASALQSTGWEAVNREYTYTGIVKLPATGDKVAMFRHPAGNVPWTAWIDINGVIKAAETFSGKNVLGTVLTIDSSGDFDSVDAETDGNTIYVDARNADTGFIHRWTSDDFGANWTPHGAITS